MFAPFLHVIEEAELGARRAPRSPRPLGPPPAGLALAVCRLVAGAEAGSWQEQEAALAPPAGSLRPRNSEVPP